MLAYPFPKKHFAAFIFASALLAPLSEASFHLMQIEQIVASAGGDSNAQAIQLRLRSGGQNVVSQGSLWATDSLGTSRVLLLNISANAPNGAGGARVLFSTSAFNSVMTSTSPGYAPDFTLLNPIPASYLSSGRLTFEDDGGSSASPGTIIWSLAWGGSSYQGSNMGSTTNDADGNFGPAFSTALPAMNGQGLLFSGPASAASVNNFSDYMVTSSPATVVRNDGQSFAVVPEPSSAGLFLLGFLSVGAAARRRK